ncbi:hypothetical protein B0H65DRAFT_139597 [Neurospora tetraspora]|uniref:Uncharacterized protein n=1 Tax=Neurospora tetraspora TaxID=94610 RepID=A0AAE0MUW3_9PEZI|nr:hypothetical protein B0H65DRAFT_139597 [Neurospora tetraspora]
MRQSLQLLAPSCRTRTSIGFVWICLLVLACRMNRCQLAPLPITRKHRNKRVRAHRLSIGCEQETTDVLDGLVGTKKAGVPMIIEANSGARQPRVFTESLDFAFFLPNRSPGASPVLYDCRLRVKSMSSHRVMPNGIQPAQKLGCMVV